MTVFDDWYTVGTTSVPIVTGVPRLYQQCTNRQKQSKGSQNSKNDHWCTNRHMCTQSPPNTQSPGPSPRPRPRPHPRPPNTQSPYWKSHMGFSKNTSRDP